MTFRTAWPGKTEWAGLRLFGAGFLGAAVPGLFFVKLRLYADTGEGPEFHDGVAWGAFILMMLVYPARIVASDIKRVQHFGWLLDGALAALTLGALLQGASIGGGVAVLVLGILAALLVAAFSAALAEKHHQRSGKPATKG